MKANGDYEISDVTRLLRAWNDSGSPRHLLGARAALMDDCEAIMGNAEASCRALTPDERRSFDLHTQQIRFINSDLAEYKRKRIAAAGANAGELRLPF